MKLLNKKNLEVSFFCRIFASQNKTNNTMSQEEKDLLLKDISARLPYGVICADIHADEKFTNKWNIFAIDRTFGNEFLQVCISNCEETYGYKIPIERIKPYLFPLSSMTEEQKEEYKKTTIGAGIFTVWTTSTYDWFNKNHFDYRGLIPMGLANDATELNIY